VKECINIIDSNGPMDERTLDRWFLREVLPHQEALLRYLRRICRSDSADAMDIMQEALVRVYSSARCTSSDLMEPFDPISKRHFSAGDLSSLIC